MNPKRVFIFFFVAYALFGFYTMPEYGVPLDELTQRYIGIQNNRFITGHATQGDLEENKYYGPVFESLSYVLEQLVYDQPLRIKLYLRHFLLFIIFLLAHYCFYLISCKLFKVKMVAELITIMLAINPLLFAHAHYNSKDTLFMCLLVFCIHFFVKYHDSKKLKWLIYMSILTGIASTIRFSGVFILFSISLGLLLWREINLKKRIELITLYFSLTLVAYYTFFPLFWIHPIEGWSALWHYITNNPWPSDILVAGHWVKPGEQPWWYLPVWMSVTIPVISWVFFILGSIQCLFKKSIHREIPFILIATVFIVPFCYTILTRPTLYDGWRHLQFLIVPMLLIAGYGLQSFLERAGSVLRFWSVFIYSLVCFLLSHPYQYVYFNEIYSAFIPKNNFTQDYWCLSSSDCLQWIAHNDPGQGIGVSSFTNSPEMQATWLGFDGTGKFNFNQVPGTGKYEIQIRRDARFENLPGKVVFTLCPMKDTIARVLLLDK